MPTNSYRIANSTGALQGVTLFLFAVIDSQAGNVAFNTLEYFFQSAFNAIL